MKSYQAFIKNGIVQGVYVCEDDFVPEVKAQLASDLTVDVSDIERRPSPGDTYVDGVFIDVHGTEL